MSIISNTGPLIALAKVGRFDVLEQLFAVVQIPPAVRRELFAGSGSETEHLDQALSRFIKVQLIPQISPEVKTVTRRLGAGEQEAIALAHQLRIPLIIDDHAGRTVARSLGIAVTGLVGVLIHAKQSGFVPNVRQLLEEIRARGYWLSDELVEQAAKLAGENN